MTKEKTISRADAYRLMEKVLEENGYRIEEASTRDLIKNNRDNQIKSQENWQKRQNYTKEVIHKFKILFLNTLADFDFGPNAEVLSYGIDYILQRIDKYKLLRFKKIIENEMGNEPVFEEGRDGRFKLIGCDESFLRTEDSPAIFISKKDFMTNSEPEISQLFKDIFQND